MKAARLLAGLAFVALGCRGVLGIEETELVEAGPDASVSMDGSAADTGSALESSTTADVGADSALPPPDTNPPGKDTGTDAPDFASCAPQTGMNCPLCCLENEQSGFQMLVMLAFQGQCVCDEAWKVNPECSASCGEKQACHLMPGDDAGSCAPCIVPVLTMCAYVTPANCMGDCQNALECLMTCGQGM